MDFTGYSYRNLLDLKSNDFFFNEISIKEMSYPTKIGVSGEGKSLFFVFSGNKVLDNSSGFVWSFNSGDPFDLRLQLENGVYQYCINSDLIGNGYRDNFKIEKLIVDTSGAGVSFDPSFFSELIDLNLEADRSFNAGSSLGFSLKNLSNAKIKIYSSEISRYQNSLQAVNFETNQTGVLSGYASTLFSSKDLTNGYEQYDDFRFSLKLNTNVGEFAFPLTVTRFSKVEGSYVNYSYPNELSISHFFDGSTGLNQFIFVREALSSDFLLQIQKRDFSNNSLDCSGFVDFNIGGFSGNSTGLFISGISFTNSGLYSGVPSVIFSSFSGVESIVVNEKNLISYEAGDSFALLFSGNGTGISATAFTKKEMINLFSGDNPSHKFRTITGVSINSGGYGFSGLYNVRLPESVIDYPYSYEDTIASSLGYAPVEFTTDFKITAGFASGRAILTSGDSGEISGVIVLGAGSGYDTEIQFPKISFKRKQSDLFTKNASGFCVLNSSGDVINFANNWEVIGGRSFSTSDIDYSLELKTGVSGYYFGPVVFSDQAPDLYIRIKSKNFASYEDSSLDFKLYETGNYKQSFSVLAKKSYRTIREPTTYEDIIISEENLIGEEEILIEDEE